MNKWIVSLLLFLFLKIRITDCADAKAEVMRKEKLKKRTKKRKKIHLNFPRLPNKKHYHFEEGEDDYLVRKAGREAMEKLGNQKTDDEKFKEEFKRIEDNIPFYYYNNIRTSRVNTFFREMANICLRYDLHRFNGICRGIMSYLESLGATLTPNSFVNIERIPLKLTMMTQQLEEFIRIFAMNYDLDIRTLKRIYYEDVIASQHSFVHCAFGEINIVKLFKVVKNNIMLKQQNPFSSLRRHRNLSTYQKKLKEHIKKIDRELEFFKDSIKLISRNLQSMGEIKRAEDGFIMYILYEMSSLFRRDNLNYNFLKGNEMMDRMKTLENNYELDRPLLFFHYETWIKEIINKMFESPFDRKRAQEKFENTPIRNPNLSMLYLYMQILNTMLKIKFIYLQLLKIINKLRKNINPENENSLYISYIYRESLPSEFRKLSIFTYDILNYIYNYMFLTFFNTMRINGLLLFSDYPLYMQTIIDYFANSLIPECQAVAQSMKEAHPEKNYEDTDQYYMNEESYDNLRATLHNARYIGGTFHFSYDWRFKWFEAVVENFLVKILETNSDEILNPN